METLHSNFLFPFCPSFIPLAAFDTKFKNMHCLIGNVVVTSIADICSAEAKGYSQMGVIGPKPLYTRPFLSGNFHEWQCCDQGF